MMLAADWVFSITAINKQWKLIALDRQGTQEQRPESPTTLSPMSCSREENIQKYVKNPLVNSFP